MDAFSSVECGKISDSQEKLLRDAPFISDSQPPSPSDGNIFPSPPSPSDPPRYADAPVLICSLPNSQNSDPPSPNPHAKSPPAISSPLPKPLQTPPSSSSIPNPQAKSPSGQPDQGDPMREDSVSAKQTRHSSRVSIKRARGTKIRTPSDEDDDGDGEATTKSIDDIDKYRFQPRQPLKDDALALRKLPPTLQNQQEGSKVPESGSVPAAGELVQPVHNAEERDGGVGKLKDALGKYRYKYAYKSLKDAIFGQNDAPVARKLLPANHIQREAVIVSDSASDSASVALAGASAQPVPVVGEGDGGVTKSKDGIDKYRYTSLQSVKDAVCRQEAACRAAPTPQKLPSKFQNQQAPSIVTDSGSPAGALAQPLPTAEIVADSARVPAVPVGLPDLISSFSKENERIFADTDILEFAASKGIHFPHPRWWRPGGYDAKVSKEAK